ncbi:DNA-3-methyladenine glycosylase II [Anaerosphaera aminiphila DSM 21120]|uniref:DNA-3-methyladenine glycosylase II n=1 Tax=Anaerosphaera aminiphila DSM 21120 TaxID=1120995 RepID=A0A1M5QTZ9_9FIRM|nr:DNA-3-methyladenine glycosylase [Anaerosphaera aminiphila]SHH17552.1 DNA-3-methyladenine glycosylase II [Anaerosphaera aminiphila DSM 21120]
MYFEYGDMEVEYLKKKDKKLAEAIEKIGPIEREVDTDLFSSVVHHIVGQQISTAAQKTIWNRMNSSLGEINVETINSASPDELQSNGITFRKADYIKDFARKVYTGEFDILSIENKSDEEIIEELVKLKGIGLWTAEMILIFGLQRKNVFSFGDLAIHRGLRMLYRHRKITEELFEKYRRRYSPYGSVASLYIWAISGGAIPEMKDCAPKKIVKKK